MMAPSSILFACCVLLLAQHVECNQSYNDLVCGGISIFNASINPPVCQVPHTAETCSWLTRCDLSNGSLTCPLQPEMALWSLPQCQDVLTQHINHTTATLTLQLTTHAEWPDGIQPNQIVPLFQKLVLSSVATSDVEAANLLFRLGETYSNLSHLELQGNIRLDRLTNGTASKLYNLTKSLRVLRFRNATRLDFVELGNLPIPNLREIHFNRCLMQEFKVPNGPQLEVLNISDNVITNLYLGALPRLTTLSAASNILTSLANTPFAKMPALQVLELQRNELTQLNDFADVMPNLTSLDLSFNLLHSLDRFNSVKMPRLTSLSVSNNDITGTVSLHSSVTRLQELRLDHNLMSSVDSVLLRSSLLRQLDLSHNNITNVDLSHLKNLSSLNIGFNQLTSAGWLKTIPKPSTLLFLALDRNKIAAFPSSMLPFPSLQTLLVAGNKVTSLPDGLFRHLSQLRDLSMDSLPLVEDLPDRLFLPLRSLSVFHAYNSQIQRISHSMVSLFNHTKFVRLDNNRIETTVDLDWFSSELRYLNLNSYGKSADTTLTGSFQHLSQLDRFEALEVRVSLETLDQLRGANITQLALSGDALCDGGAVTKLTLLGELPSLETFTLLGPSRCRSLLLVQRQPFDALRISNHDQLTTIQLDVRTTQTAISRIDFSNNTALASVPVWTKAVDLDISNTSLGYTPTFCTFVGTKRFSAAGTFKNLTAGELANLLEDCYARVDWLDLTGNKMENVQVFKSVFGRRSIVPINDRGDVFLDDATVTVSHSPPMDLSLDGPIQCTPHYGHATFIDASEAFEDTRQMFFVYNCECGSGYVERDGKCILKSLIFNKALSPTQLALAITLPLLLFISVTAFLSIKYYHTRWWYRLTLSRREQRIRRLLTARKVDYQRLKYIRALGKGTFGRVDLCTFLGAPVAVKSLNALALTDAIAVSQFRNEVDFLLMCSHLHICYCLGWGIRSDQTRFLVLEFVQGGDLRQALKAHGDMFDSPTCLSVIRDVACGLDYLLQQFQRSHSDLKPDNILVDFEHSPPRGVCTDFGSLRLQAETSQPRRRRTVHSRPNETKDLDELLLAEFDGSGESYDSMPFAPGSPLYMSPEIMHVRRYVIEGVTPASDAWALGVIMWELVHRTLPDLLALHNCEAGGPVSYRFRETHQLLDQGQTLWNAPNLEPSIDVNNTAGRELVRLSQACLQLDPAQRPGFDAILRAYEEVFRSSDS
eukprot:m.185469 g.185469  ORF g.185469 m.185469 type:complete len:1217 (-) comp16914_c0_seq1:75-3725(-)